MVRCLVASDIRVLHEGGVARATHPAGGYATFEPLLGVFQAITVISRESETQNLTAGPVMTGVGVSHRAVPDYSSFRGLIYTLLPTMRIVWRSLDDHGAAVVRLPEPLSLVVASMALLRGRTLISNIVADPATAFATAPQVVGKSVALWTRALARRSDAVIYVTKSYLQRLISVSDQVPQLSRSNAQIPHVNQAPRPCPIGPVRILCVGTTSRLSKGQDTLLLALAHLRALGVDAHLTLIGGGDRVEWLRTESQSLGLADYCDIRGHVNDPAELTAAYVNADVFCLLSRSEGLPRAMLEAMSHGVPAIGSTAGGIPELLPDHLCLSDPSPVDVAFTLKDLVSHPATYVQASQHALETARTIQESAAPEHLVDFLGSIIKHRSEENS